MCFSCNVVSRHRPAISCGVLLKKQPPKKSKNESPMWLLQRIFQKSSQLYSNVALYRLPQHMRLYKCVCVCVCVHMRMHSVMSDSATPWTVAHQAPLSVGFSRQEYWSGWPFPPPEDLPYPGIKPGSPALAGKFFTTEPPGNPNLADMWLKIGRPKERIIRTPWNWGRSS